MSETSLFQTDWWCDASNPGEWEKVECSDGGRLTAEFVYARKKKYGFYEVGMPYLARVMSPTIISDSKKMTTQVGSSVKAIKSISEQLPKFDHFWYTLPPESSHELAFNLAGFSTESQYTFRRHPGEGEDPWPLMDQKTRNIVKKGLSEFQLEIHYDLDRFIGLSKLFIAGKSWFNKIDYDAVARIFEACATRGRATILSAVAEDQSDAAIAIVVWDQKCLYYWLATRHPEAAGNSANSVLIWHAMQFAEEMNLIFDMDGFASPSSGQFLSKFGLTPVRRTHVTRISTIADWSANSRILLKSIAPISLKNRMIKPVRQAS